MKAKEQMNIITKELISRTLLGQCSANNAEYAKLYQDYKKWEAIEKRGECRGLQVTL